MFIKGHQKIRKLEYVKILKKKNQDYKYFILDSHGRVLNISKNLQEVLFKTRWKKLKLVN